MRGHAELRHRIRARAHKLIRGLREELTVGERYRVIDDVVHRLKWDGDRRLG
jgi:ribosomal protein L35